MTPRDSSVLQKTPSSFFTLRTKAFVFQSAICPHMPAVLYVTQSRFCAQQSSCIPHLTHPVLLTDRPAVPLVELMYLVFSRMPGELQQATQVFVAVLVLRILSAN